MAVTKDWLGEGKARTVTLTYAKADVFNGQPAIGQKFDPGHEGLAIWSVKFQGQADAATYWKIGSSDPLAVGQEITIHARKDTNGDKSYFKAFTPEQYAKETAPKGGFGGGGGKTYSPPNYKAQAWPDCFAAVLGYMPTSFDPESAVKEAARLANIATKLMEV